MKEDSARFNPFPGLRSFEPREEHLFFGREQQIDDLLKRLRRTRFLAVVGISGSGKSSLVLSGLIPALHRGLMTRAGSGWRVAIFRPGDDPVGNLAAALARPDVLGVEGEQTRLRHALLEATLRRGALGLVECVREARELERRIPKYDNVLVVVDQFEELFRLKASSRRKSADDEAVAFVRLLQEAAQQKEVPIYVVLTMRTDFMEHCVGYPGLPEMINDGAFIVSRMSREQQRAAIVGPVAVGGGEIAPRLVLRLLNSVSDDPDQLPVLQHALMRTWDHWQRKNGEQGVLDVEQYEAIGTMERALSQHAEEVYEDLGTERRRMIAEKTFKALTDKSPGRRGVRRPIQVREVCELTGASTEEVVAVVDCFRQPGRSFLMPPAAVPLHADSVVDISHESLMRVWDRLIDWVEEETESAQFYLRIARAAELHEEGSAGLWRDPELEFGLQWREKHRPTEAWARRYDPSFERVMRYLDQSRAARDRQRQAEEGARLKKLRQARLMTGVAVVVAAIILVFGLLALQERAKAEQESERAHVAEQEAREAAEEATRQKAIAEQKEQEAREAAEEATRQKAFAEQKEQEAREAAEEATHQKAFAEDQKAIAVHERAFAERQKAIAEEKEQEAIRAAEEARLQETEARRQGAIAEEKEQEARLLRLRELARALAVQTPRRLQEAGQRELAALLAVQAYRFDQDGGGEQKAPEIHDALWSSLLALEPEQGAGTSFGSAVRTVAALADGTLRVGTENGLYRLRPNEEPELVTWPEDVAPQGAVGGGDEIRSMAVSPSGDTFAAGTFRGEVLLWSLAAETFRHLGTHSPTTSEADDVPAVSALAFGASGDLFSGSLTGEVRRWNPEDGLQQPWLPVRTPVRRILALAVSGDGTTLAAAREGGGVLLWHLGEAPGEPLVLAERRNCGALAFHRDATTLLCGGKDGSIYLWDLTAGGAVERKTLLGHTGSVNALRFSPDGDVLASASSDKSLRLWKPDAPDREPVVLRGHTSWVWTLAWSEDGSTLISGGADRTVRRWMTRNRQLVDEICRRLDRRTLSDTEWSQLIGPDIPREATCPDSPEDPRNRSRAR